MFTFISGLLGICAFVEWFSRLSKQIPGEFFSPNFNLFTLRSVRSFKPLFYSDLVSEIWFVTFRVVCLFLFLVLRFSAVISRRTLTLYNNQCCNHQLVRSMILPWMKHFTVGDSSVARLWITNSGVCCEGRLIISRSRLSQTPQSLQWPKYSFVLGAKLALERISLELMPSWNVKRRPC